jgi:hypothetical protein
LLWSQGNLMAWPCLAPQRWYGTNWVSFPPMTNSFTRSPAAAIGALLGAATIPLNLLFSQMHSEQFAAVLLAVTGAIYIGFSLQKGNRVQIATELTVATGFFAAALAGLWVTPWIVPVLMPRMEFGIMRTTRVQGSHPYPQSSSPYPYGTLHFAPSPTGWWRRPWRLCWACVSK